MLSSNLIFNSCSAQFLPTFLYLDDEGKFQNIYTAGSYNNKLICPILLVSVTSKIPQLETCHQEKYLNNSKLKPPLITMNATRWTLHSLSYSLSPSNITDTSSNKINTYPFDFWKTKKSRDKFTTLWGSNGKLII